MKEQNKCGSQIWKIFSFPVVLASASPRRRDILNQIGIEPVIMPSQVEEHITSSDSEQIVKELSWQKAEDVYRRCQKELGGRFAVIGADTIVAADGEILGKPKDEEDAKRMIRLISGRVHQVYTGVTILYEGRTVTFAEKTDVSVASMTEREIEEYVSCGESMDKAGAYGVQGVFAAFIEGVNGSYTSVVGLPAGRTYRKLRELAEGIE